MKTTPILFRKLLFSYYFLFYLIITVLCVACNDAQHENQKTKKTTLGNFNGYIKKNGKRVGIIIFVHGVLSNSKDAWYNVSTHTYFPDLIANDSVFANYDVFALSYPTTKFDDAYVIDEIAEDVRVTFDNQDIFSYPIIIFACHSMGGLVIRSFIIKNREVLIPKTKLIYFYATPTESSQMSKIGRWFSPNRQFEIMEPDNGQRYLGDMSRNWKGNLSRIPSYCAYERGKVAGLKTIVDFNSATALCNQDKNAVLANHMDISKPISREDKSYIVFRNAFKKGKLQIVKQKAIEVKSGNSTVKKVVLDNNHSPNEKMHFLIIDANTNQPLRNIIVIAVSQQKRYTSDSKGRVEMPIHKDMMSTYETFRFQDPTNTYTDRTLNIRLVSKADTTIITL